MSRQSSEIAVLRATFAVHRDEPSTCVFDEGDRIRHRRLYWRRGTYLGKCPIEGDHSVEFDDRCILPIIPQHFRRETFLEYLFTFRFRWSEIRKFFP